MFVQKPTKTWSKRQNQAKHKIKTHLENNVVFSCFYDYKLEFVLHPQTQSQAMLKQNM